MNELPLRKTVQGDEIETRPLYIEEWLEALPYIDFEKTSTLLHNAIAKTNQSQIKPSTRLELVALYSIPYQHYIESQIKTGTWHTLQTVDAIKAQVSPMMKLAFDLSYSCKLAVETILNTKTTRWRQAKPPVEEMLLSMFYLSHALIFSFLSYSPTSKYIWQQLHTFYDFAEMGGYHKTKYTIAGATTSHLKKSKLSIEQVYKRIMMVSLIDPHHLPFGAIWEIYEQLNDWIEHIHIHAMRTVSNSSGYFVIDLKSDGKAIPYDEFNIQVANDKTRLLEAISLQTVIQAQIDLLKKGRVVEKPLILSSFYAELLLAYMLKAWSTQPKRYLPRKKQYGDIEIISGGINALYYVLNNGTAFQRINPETEDNEDGNGIIAEEEPIPLSDNFIAIEQHSIKRMKSLDSSLIGRAEKNLSIMPSDTFNEANNINIIDILNNEQDLLKDHYTSETWHIVDKSSSGYAMMREQKPKRAIRVGDLVSTKLDENKDWTISVVRWLTVRDNHYKVGLQNIANVAKLISLKACYGNMVDRQYHPAFLINQANNSPNFYIMTEKELYMPMREMEINVDGVSQLIIVESIIEQGICYDLFSYKSL